MESDCIIYHLTPSDYYSSLPADQPYRPREFDRDGFIHCTAGEEHLLLMANTVYRHVPGDFLLLVIDERKVTSPVRHENVGGILFPHIYGPLNRDAIVRVVAMGRREDGTFLPIGEQDTRTEAAQATEARFSQARVEQLLAESADLRARTTARLTQIEKEIANLKSQIARQVFPTPTPASVIPAAATVSTSMQALEARVERLERSLHQLAARIESLETQTSKPPISKPAPVRTRRKAAAHKKRK